MSDQPWHERQMADRRLGHQDARCEFVDMVKERYELVNKADPRIGVLLVPAAVAILAEPYKERCVGARGHVDRGFRGVGVRTYTITGILSGEFEAR